MQDQANTEYWQAVRDRDRSYEGRFVFAVLSTGVYCRPGCASRTPKPGNVRFFDTPQQAVQAGFRACLRCRPDEHSLDGVERICQYITARLEDRLSLQQLADFAGLSPFHLHRKFKAALGVTPRQYAEQKRMTRLKSAIRGASSVTEAIYQAGFSSSSRAYERTNSHLGMTPKAYRKGGAAQTIRYAIRSTPMGLLLVAATDVGVCSIRFGESDSGLIEELAAEFQAATLIHDEQALSPHLEPLGEWLEGQRLPLDLPLDVKATAFQGRVWQYLRKIPYGTTKTYTQIARDLGKPAAARAVARACATNPVALAIPCHRVVRQDGGLAGYRWGIGIKESLLKLEAQSSRISAD